MGTIKINESQLHRIITEAIKRTLNEEMEWPFREDDEIWAQISKEGGMSWSDGNGTELKIEKETGKNGIPIYVVYDENGELEGYSKFLHKAQKYLHDAVVRVLDSPEEPTEEEY